MYRLRKLIRSTFFEDKYIRVPYFAGSVLVCPTHIMGETVFEGKIHEPELTRLIQFFIQSGFSFIDVGANVGLHTVAAANLKAKGDQTFIAFEPDPAMFAVLKKNCEVNQINFVECIQEGLGNQDTFLRLNISQTRNKGHNSFLPINSASQGYNVKVSTLDTRYANEKALLDKNILIKIDVEGYELPVIQGGKTFISRVSNMAIACEVWPELMKENNLSVDTLYQTLSDCGFNKHIDTSEAVIFFKGPACEEVIGQGYTNK